MNKRELRDNLKKQRFNNVKSINNEEWRYLGPSSWNQRLLRLAPFSKRFNRAAMLHDINYGIGGNWENKRYADEKFAYDMAKVCGFNPFAWLFGFIYFLSVVILGVFFFNFHEPRNINAKKSLKPVQN